nr:MAG TPA: hypothetical protein [Caudoviricetes sp.]
MVHSTWIVYRFLGIRHKMFTFPIYFSMTATVTQLIAGPSILYVTNIPRLKSSDFLVCLRTS